MKRRALIVGINHYEEPEFTNLNFAIHDATEVKSFLQALGEGCHFDETVLLDNPAFKTVKTELRNLTDGLGPGDVFLFYFAGHGIEQQLGGKHLLLCPDADPTVLEDGTNGAISYTYLTRGTRDGGFDRLFILDACRQELLRSELNKGERGGTQAGRVMSGSAAFRDLGVASDTPAQGSCMTICSCSDGERAAEHAELRGGLFTRALVETLQTRYKSGQELLVDGTFVAELTDCMQGLSVGPMTQTPQLRGSGRGISLGVPTAPGPTGSSLGSELSQKLDRRTQRLLQLARNALQKSFNLKLASSYLDEAYLRYQNHDVVRRLYLSVLAETDPDMALQIMGRASRADKDGMLLQIEILARRGDIAGAYAVLSQAQTEYGEEDPVLIACDADLSLEDYRKRGGEWLEDARELVAKLPAETDDPYLLTVKAYLAHVEGDTGALPAAREAMSGKGLDLFCIHRKISALGLNEVQERPPQAPGNCTVTLVAPGSLPIQLITKISEVRMEGWTAAQKLVENTPAVIKQRLSGDDAERMRDELVALGAEVTIADGADAANENPAKDVVITSVGPAEMQVIQTLCAAAKANLGDASRMVRSVPVTVAEGLDAAAAQALQTELEKAGAVVELR